MQRLGLRVERGWITEQLSPRINVPSLGPRNHHRGQGCSGRRDCLACCTLLAWWDVTNGPRSMPLSMSGPLPADRGSGSLGTVYLRADPTWPLPVLEGSLGPELTAAVPKGYASVDGAGFVGRGCHFHDSQHTELEFMKSVPFAHFHPERTHKGSSQRLIQGQPGCCSSRDIPEGQLPGADPSHLEPCMLAVTRGHMGGQAESRTPASLHGHRLRLHLKTSFHGPGGLQSGTEGVTPRPVPSTLHVSQF